MSFVLDASVALAWCFADEGGEYADGVLDALEREEAFVPTLWPLEVSNGLLTAERHGRMGAQEGTRVIRLLLSLPIAVEPAERARAFGETRRLARSHGLSAYDATYLEMTVRLGLPLATLDRELRKAAEREGVEVFGAGSPPAGPESTSTHQ